MINLLNKQKQNNNIQKTAIQNFNISTSFFQFQITKKSSVFNITSQNSLIALQVNNIRDSLFKYIIVLNLLVLLRKSTKIAPIQNCLGV
jgi:hypothetical protein